MTQQIKPKQCGENAWYIPNQTGFVPSKNGGFWFCSQTGRVVQSAHHCYTTDYAYINSGNCFETEQEALDAFVKPVDPTPLTWDELCEIADIDGSIYYARPILGCTEACETDAVEVKEAGQIHFQACCNLWRSEQALFAWFEKQKG
jgi:hypothetical protein